MVSHQPLEKEVTMGWMTHHDEGVKASEFKFNSLALRFILEEEVPFRLTHATLCEACRGIETQPCHRSSSCEVR